MPYQDQSVPEFRRQYLHFIILGECKRDLEFRARMLTGYVQSTVLQGCKYTALRKSDERRLQVFEFWCCGNALKIS